ncbi:ribosomal protein L22 [Acrasis kona]|uniref:Large ribosomal subunit protein eL22 n=1 Tax=Acrasis kona TaxID=1008807 RepID=A0AAW2ZGW4_9EUKA
MVRKGVEAQSSARKAKGVKQQRKITYKYFVDTDIPVKDGIFNLDNFADYVSKKYKVDNKAGNLGDVVTLYKSQNKLHVNTTQKISQRYLKYLTKKYLKKQELRDWLHVVSTPKKRGYELRYFNITQGNDEEAPAAESQ